MATVTVRGAASVAATPDEAGVAIELSGLGVRLRALRRVREPRLGPAPRGVERATMAAVADAPTIGVDPGEQQVAAAVDGTYVLEPA